MEMEWKEVIKKAHKTKGKESPLCCIDGHQPHPKVRLHPGECSQMQSQVWKLSSPDEEAAHELPEKVDEAGIRAEIWIGTIINKVVDGCHQRKVTRMSSKSSSSTSTIIEYSGMSHMNFDKSWIMNTYGSLLREKEENFDNLCCESSQSSVE